MANFYFDTNVIISNAIKKITAIITTINGANLGVNWTKTKIRIPKATAVTAIQNSVLDNPLLLY